MPEQLNRTTAIAKQHFDDLTKLVGLDEIEAGKLGEGARRKRVQWLLERLDRTIIEIQGMLSEKLKADTESPLLSLPTSHAKFLLQVLLPNARLIQTAYLKASGLDLLLPLLDDHHPQRSRPGWNALSFAVDYASNLLAEDDDRRLEIEIAEDILEEPWFAPDRWRHNMRQLRPVLVALEVSTIPPSIQFRLAEVYRTFTFGTWMATIALCRATVEFALTNTARHLGFSPTRKRGDRYLMLNDLIGLTIPRLPHLKEQLVTIKRSGNRVLHPETRQNVVPSPRILKDEALGCVAAMIQVIEALYAERSSDAGQ